MTTHEWYRNTIWNSNIENDFEARLKRSRGAFSKAQYLRIQASYLLNSSETKTQLVGIKQMERLIKDFPDEEFSTILGHEQLGDYYFNLAEYEKAEYHFGIVVERYRTKKTRSGTSAKADLKLADIFLTANMNDRFEEAYQICKEFPINDLTFNNDKFYYFELMAHICDKLGKKNEAKDYAKTAIEISRIIKPQFYRHKTIGLVKTTKQQLNTLEHIVNE